MAQSDSKEMMLAELNRSTPSAVFVKFGFEWEMFDIDSNGNTIPKRQNLTGKNAKNNLIKISDPNKEEIFKKLAKLLKKYQDFVDSLGEENGS